ncbi:hypothetical protein PspLS_06192 [Pyricularia sp. CBS 133598]|nr:hypothetical protein PspLS_06192 [Pyricularia sp. CBS 133598]
MTPSRHLPLGGLLLSRPAVVVSRGAAGQAAVLPAHGSDDGDVLEGGEAGAQQVCGREALREAVGYAVCAAPQRPRAASDGEVADAVKASRLAPERGAARRHYPARQADDVPAQVGVDAGLAVFAAEDELVPLEGYGSGFVAGVEKCWWWGGACPACGFGFRLEELAGGGGGGLVSRSGSGSNWCSSGGVIGCSLVVVICVYKNNTTAVGVHVVRSPSPSYLRYDEPQLRQQSGELREGLWGAGPLSSPPFLEVVHPLSNRVFGSADMCPSLSLVLGDLLRHVIKPTGPAVDEYIPLQTQGGPQLP